MADPISEALTQKVPRPDYNVREGWIVVPKFPPSDSRYGKTSPDGGTGVYQVTFVLGIPGKNVFREHVVMGQTHLDGIRCHYFQTKSRRSKCVSMTANFHPLLIISDR